MSDKSMGGQKNNDADTPNHTVMSANISKHPNADAAHISFLASTAYFIWGTCIN